MACLVWHASAASYPPTDLYHAMPCQVPVAHLPVAQPAGTFGYLLRGGGGHFVRVVELAGVFRFQCFNHKSTCLQLFIILF